MLASLSTTSPSPRTERGNPAAQLTRPLDSDHMYGRLRGLRSPSHPRVPGTLDAGATADGAPDAERKREEAEANEREEADHRAHSVLEDPRSAIQHSRCAGHIESRSLSEASAVLRNKNRYRCERGIRSRSWP